MIKKVTAFILGVISFFLMFGVGEPFGVAAAFIIIGIYYLVAQFLLSRGNPRALYEDWPIVFILNAVMIVTAVMVLLIEPDPDAKWTAVVALISLVASVIGAGLAALLAEKR